MNKAVFIDRDGVINSDEGHYYIFKPEDFKLNKGIKDALKLLHEAGYLIIIISNQGGIGKGFYFKKDADFIHLMFQEEMKKMGVIISEIYYCPHFPDSGNCLCRKPNPLLIEKAIARFQINKTLSFMIGDSPRDIESAQKAGIKGYLTQKNESILSLVKSIISK